VSDVVTNCLSIQADGPHFAIQPGNIFSEPAKGGLRGFEGVHLSRDADERRDEYRKDATIGPHIQDDGAGREQFASEPQDRLIVKVLFHTKHMLEVDVLGVEANADA
jgi:hypothetical protein